MIDIATRPAHFAAIHVCTQRRIWDKERVDLKPIAANMSVSLFVSYEPDGSPPLPDKDRKPLNLMVSKCISLKQPT